MFTPDGILEHPYAPPGLDTPIAGRDAIVANFQKLGTLLRIDGVTGVSEIEVGDPDMVVLEFSGCGEGVLTGEAYHRRYISVIRMQDGCVVRYKDYWNPIARLRAVKGTATTVALMMD